MAGLLDQGYAPDPLAMGLLGLGSSLLTPRQLGGGIGPGMQAFSQQAMQAQMMQRQMAQDAMRQKYLEAQIAETTAQADERKRATKAAEDKAAGQKAVLAGIQPQVPGFRDASIAMTGNAPAGYTPPTGRVQITPQQMAAWVANGGDPKVLEAIATAPDLGRLEVARTIEGADAQGRPQTAQFDKFGGMIGPAIPKAYERKTVDIGGSILDRDPYTGQQLGSILKSLTPGDVQQAKDAAAGRSVTMRGQDMSAATAAERLAFDRQNGGEKLPAGYRWTPEGNQTFIPGGPADPATRADKFPTEVQAKDNLFARRAIDAEKAVISLGDKPSLAGVATKNNLSNIPLIGGAIGAVGNFALSDASQQYDQAKRNFINAVLRRESGAVISESEFKNADIQYFPQPGDSDAVRLQKAQNRRTAIEGLAAGAGPLGKDMPTLPPPGAQGRIGAAAGSGGVLRFDANGNLVK